MYFYILLKRRKVNLTDVYNASVNYDIPNTHTNNLHMVLLYKMEWLTLRLITQHLARRLNIPINEEYCELSTLCWIPIFQKNQYLDRYIPRSSTCLTKELSITMIKMLHADNEGLLSYCDKEYSRGNINQKHRIGGVMVSVLASSAVDRGLESRSGQTKDYAIGMCCFYAKHAALQRKKEDWLARNLNHVSEWSAISTRELLFQWASTIEIQLSVLV